MSYSAGIVLKDEQGKPEGSVDLTLSTDGIRLIYGAVGFNTQAQIVHLLDEHEAAEFELMLARGRFEFKQQKRDGGEAA